MEIIDLINNPNQLWELYNSGYRISVTKYNELAKLLDQRNDLVNYVEYGYYDCWEYRSPEIQESLNIIVKMGFPFSLYPELSRYQCTGHSYNDYFHCPLKLKYETTDNTTQERYIIICLIDSFNKHSFQAGYTMLQKYPEIYNHIYDYQRNRSMKNMHFNIAKYKPLTFPRKLHDTVIILD